MCIAARHACSWGACAPRDEGRERKEAQARRVCAYGNHLVSGRSGKVPGQEGGGELEPKR